MTSSISSELAPPVNDQRVRKIMQRIDGGRLTLHRWLPEHPRLVMFHVHGLQSHAGWSWDLASALARRGVAFLSLDRAGSGLSEGPRDRFPDAEEVVRDHRNVLMHVRAENPGLPVVAIGHCLGGSILTATLASHPELAEEHLDGVVIVSAWLSRLHGSQPPEQRRNIAGDTSDEPWDTGLRAEDFSGDERYRTFIREDPLAMRTIARSSRRHLLALEERYQGVDLSGVVPDALFVTSDRDPVIDVTASIAAFRDVYGADAPVTRLPSAYHYLPFTDAAASFVDLLATIGDRP